MVPERESWCHVERRSLLQLLKCEIVRYSTARRGRLNESVLTVKISTSHQRAAQKVLFCQSQESLLVASFPLKIAFFVWMQQAAKVFVGNAASRNLRMMLTFFKPAKNISRISLAVQVCCVHYPVLHGGEPCEYTWQRRWRSFEILCTVDFGILATLLTSL